MSERAATTQLAATDPAELWRPRAEVAAASRMTQFQDRVNSTHGTNTADYEELWQWSVEEPELFWAALWDFFDVKASQPYQRVLATADMPGAHWFPGARLNYAE